MKRGPDIELVMEVEPIRFNDGGPTMAYYPGKKRYSVRINGVPIKIKRKQFEAIRETMVSL